MPAELFSFYEVFYRYKRISVQFSHYGIFKPKKLERNKPICAIVFRTKEHMEEYDINNNVDKFHLYLDGEEIDFY